MLHISLIGCGRWGRNILSDLLSLGCDVAVADPAVEARRCALATGARQVFETLQELPPSDGIVIASTTSMHASVIEHTLELGVPIFVEKPMTCDRVAADRLAKAGTNRLFVMDKWRYHPGIEELRRIAVSGEFGRPAGMHLRQVGWGLPHSDVDVTWILLSHCLSIALEVLGDVPVAKQAFAERLGGDAVTLTGVLGEDPWATVEVSSRSPIRRREFRLHCELGVAWLDDGWERSHQDRSRCRCIGR